MRNKGDIYAGGYKQLMRDRQKRCKPFKDVDIVLPPADIDLKALLAEIVEAPGGPLPDKDDLFARSKWAKLQHEFDGKSALLLLHGMMIALSRRSDPPEVALGVFHRCWEETGEELAQMLSTRWLVSAAVTFAEHGRTGDQRALGMGLSVLFDITKLNDSERRLSGRDTRDPFVREDGGRLFDMPFGLSPYAMRKGDLDRVVLGRLWELTQKDDVMRPLGEALLTTVMTDRRSVFARLQKIKSILATRAKSIAPD